jgi:hypothetical protein
MRDVLAVPSGVVEVLVDGKENIVPAEHIMEDGLGHLFEEGPIDLELPPMTPTPKRRSERILLQTPSKTPQRLFGADLSSNAELLPSFRTPKAKPVQQNTLMAALLGTVQRDVLHMTPLTRSIHDAITSDAGHGLEDGKARLRSSAKKNTPSKAINFDFPDLPSLKNSSPISSDQLINFNFSELTTDHLNSEFNDPFTTHSTMPSSPPAGYFDFLENEETEMAAIWEDMIDSNATTDAQESSYPDPESLGVKCQQPLRRSPRKVSGQSLQLE